MYNISEITTSGAETFMNVQFETEAVYAATKLHSPDGCFRASIVNPEWFAGCDEHGHGGNVPADALRIVARLDAALAA